MSPERSVTHVSGTDKFARQPEVDAAIRNTIGQTYIDLGLFPAASKQLDRAVDLRRRVLGPEHPDTLKSMTNLAESYRHQDKFAQAESLDSQALEIQSRVLGTEHPDTLKSMTNLAEVYRAQSKLAQAEALNSQAMEIQRRVLGPEHPDTLMSMYNLSLDYWAEASRRSRKRSTTRFWRSGAGCWVPSIPTR